MAVEANPEVRAPDNRVAESRNFRRVHNTPSSMLL
jgi:hypothetical protein